MSRGLLLAVALLVAGLVAVHPETAFADSRPYTSIGHHVPDDTLDVTRSVLLGLALGASGVLGLLGTGRRRKRAVLVLAGLLCVFAIESAVHSVHHLDAPQALGACAVLAAATHVVGVCDDAWSVFAPTWIVSTLPCVDPAGFALPPWFRPDEGRAPPAAPTA